MVAGFEGAGAALDVAQAGERELDVLAGAQRVGHKVRAGAEIIAQTIAADSHAVGAPALRIGDSEVGKDRLAAEIDELELLLPPELPAQRGLPGFEGHVLGLARAGESGFAGDKAPGGGTPGERRGPRLAWRHRVVLRRGVRRKSDSRPAHTAGATEAEGAPPPRTVHGVCALSWQIATGAAALTADRARDSFCVGWSQDGRGTP